MAKVTIEIEDIDDKQFSVKIIPDQGNPEDEAEYTRGQQFAMKIIKYIKGVLK